MKPLPWFQPFLDAPRDVMTLPKVGKIDLPTLGIVGGAFVCGAYLGFSIFGIVGAIGISIIFVLGMMRVIFRLEGDAGDMVSGWIHFHGAKILQPEKCNFIVTTHQHSAMHGTIVVFDKDRQARTIIEQRGKR